MNIGKSHAIFSQRIDVRRANLTTIPAKATRVTIAKVIRKDKDNIRFGGGMSRGD